jgi:hypothetical protein
VSIFTTSPARGPAGAAGAQGPAGPAGPAGAGVATSICGKWVEEAGVFGVDTPFAIGDWEDVSTVAPNTAGALAVTAAVVEGALRIIPTPGTNAGAINVDISGVADGDDVCFRVAAQNQGASIGTGNTHSVFAAVFQAAGADTPWIGGGFARSNISWGSSSNPTLGRYGGATTVAGAALGADTATGIASAAIYTAFDIRIRRVAAGVTVWMAFGGGPWMAVQTAGATVNMASGTVRAGIRVQCNAAQTFAVSLLAFKHFAGGLPADLQQA